MLTEADKAKLKKHLVIQNASLSKYLFVAGFRRRGGLPFSVRIMSSYKKGKRAYSAMEKAKTCMPPSPPSGKAAEHTPPQLESMNPHSLTVPKALCSFSWETQLIHLQPPKFNLVAVRTGSRGAVQSSAREPRQAGWKAELGRALFSRPGSHPGT